MPKMNVGRKVTYFEVFEIDTDKVPSDRDDLDLCQRVLWAVDPVLSQQLKSFTKEAKSSIRFLYRAYNGINENPIYPVPVYPEGLDECPRYEEQQGKDERIKNLEAVIERQKETIKNQGNANEEKHNILCGIKEEIDEYFLKG